MQKNLMNLLQETGEKKVFTKWKKKEKKNQNLQQLGLEEEENLKRQNNALEKEVQI